MKVRLSKASLGGTVSAPPSKSCMHRALICAAAADEPVEINCTSFSKDIEATINCLSALGARFEYSDTAVTVYPIDKSLPSEEECVLDCNESGSTLRFMLPFAAALGRKCKFTGAERLGQRPLLPLCEAMEKHGVRVSYDGAFLPCRIEGKLTGGRYEIPGNISSQFITGLLLALGICDGGEIVSTTPIESAPYIEITKDIQKQFGINVLKTENGYIVPKGQSYCSPGKFMIEGDWSNGAFWLVAGATGGSELTCTALYSKSSQGDRKTEEILRLMGADITRSGDNLTVRKSNLKAIEIDCSDIPDLVPVLCVAASAAEGTTVFKNTERLREKESDRVVSTADMLSRLGGKIVFDENTISVTGSELSGGKVSSFNDHRIAMSAAVASLRCKGDVIIDGAEAVEKSYPDFYEKLVLLGGKYYEL